MDQRLALNGLALLGLLASTTVLAETQPGFYRRRQRRHGFFNGM